MYGVVSFFLWTYIHKPEPPNWHQCLISAASRMCFQKHGICRRGCGCGCCSVIIRTITFFVVDSYYVNIYIYTTSFATLKRIASQDMNVYHAITLVVFSTYTYVVNIFFNQPLCHGKKKARCTPGGMTLSLLAMSSMKRVTPGHVGLIEDGGRVVGSPNVP